MWLSPLQAVRGLRVLDAAPMPRVFLTLRVLGCGTHVGRTHVWGIQKSVRAIKVLPEAESKAEA